MPGMADDGRGQRRERTDADVGEEKKKMDQLRVGADISKTAFGWLICDVLNPNLVVKSGEEIFTKEYLSSIVGSRSIQRVGVRYVTFFRQPNPIRQKVNLLMTDQSQMWRPWVRLRPPNISGQ